MTAQQDPCPIDYILVLDTTATSEEHFAKAREWANLTLEALDEYDG